MIPGSRRTFFRAVAPVVAGMAAGCGQGRDSHREAGLIEVDRPSALGWSMPAEWHPHARCWMAWPAREDRWGDLLRDLRAEVARLARTIARFEPVVMVASPETAEPARAACGPDVAVLPLPIDDIWTRDSGPTFLLDGKGEVAGVSWRFTAWGGKHERFAADATLGRRLLDHAGLTCFPASLGTEGGAFHVDGEGTVLTTETTILNPNRNPGSRKADVEATLRGWLGADKVIWLPGSTADTITDGHVDGIAAFVRPGVAVAEITPDRADPEYAELQENLKALRLATDARGRRLEVAVVRRPTEVGRRGESFCASYVNFYLANGAVVMPEFGDNRGADTAARGVLSQLFPDRQVVPVPLSVIPEGGGGIHCVTQQQPKAR